MRTVIFIDFNSYFAAVEQHANPALRGKPVAVIAAATDTTCCIAASQEAKRFGIKTGTPVHEARARCPGIIFQISESAKYMDYHHRLVDLISEEVPLEKVCSVDEMYAVFHGPYAERAPMEQIARAVKARLAAEFGGPLTCSIGMASSVFLAKTASDMQKPDGLVWLDANAPGDAFFQLELSAFCGIGKNMLERLHRCGIYTVPTLWNASPALLRKAWGGIEGERFWQALHGIEPAIRETVTRQVGHSKILHPDLRHEEGARAMLDRLTYKAAMRLRRTGHEAAQMIIETKSFHGPKWQQTQRFASTNEVRPILATWREIWAQRPTPLPPPHAVSVVLTALNDAGDHRLALFSEAPRDQALSQTLEQISQRHGKNSIWFGSAHEAVNEDVMRIAFAALPKGE